MSRKKKHRIPDAQPTNELDPYDVVLLASEKIRAIATLFNSFDDSDVSGMGMILMAIARELQVAAEKIDASGVVKGP